MDEIRVRTLAEALRDGREEIARRWLERIAARVAVDREFVFPSEDLLDGIPDLVDGIAVHLANGGLEISTDAPVVATAKELGRLRFSQGFSARQILWEYELLGALILQYLDELDSTITSIELPAAFVKRLLRAMLAVQRATVEEYLAQSEAKVNEREGRLRGFNRALSHELRSEVNAILSAGQMLREPFVFENATLRDRFLQMIISNGQRIDQLVANLLELARVELDTRRNRNVLLPHAVTEIARQLRGFAETHGVRIETDPELPPLEVSASVIDLALTNLVGNAIKYHRPEATERWVRVRAERDAVANGDEWLTIEVVDNGRGVPEEDRPLLFERFFRSSSTADVHGTGLGLSLVREAVARLGGSVWAEFAENGETTFAFTIPARRAADS
jgi:signal transduction histidine kinase